MDSFRYRVKSALVSIVSRVASGPSLSSTGRVKVPTPGPYSTNRRVFAQSTGPSILSISTRLDGITDPTITGFFRKPRRNCQRGLGERRSCRRCRRRGLFIVRADEDGMKAPLGEAKVASVGKCVAPLQGFEREPLLWTERRSARRVIIATKRFRFVYLQLKPVSVASIASKRSVGATALTPTHFLLLYSAMLVASSGNTALQSV